ncbi:hypothetical protein IJ596_03185 [bacterium]|nr:hypothetical protein [bacterium]
MFINYPLSFMSSTGHATNASYANIPFSGVLPMMYTNFGGDLQVTNCDPYGGYNLGILFNQLAAQSWGMTSMYAADPITCSAGMAGGAQMAQSLLAPTYNNLASQNINSASQTIQCAKTKLEAELNKDGIKDEDKQAIQQTLDKIKELEEKLNKLKESTDLDPQTAYEQSKEINNEINKTLSDAQKAAAEREDGKKAEEADKTDDTKTGDTKSDDTKADTKTQSDKKAEDDDAAQPQGVKTDVDEFDINTQGSIQQLHDAMYQCGTDDATLNGILDTVNKDNVMDLMLGWNKYHSGQKGESFMDAFMWDASSGFLGIGMGSGQKKKYGSQIALALRLKAEELGVYDQCKNDFDIINEEMDSWVYISNDVSKNYDNIIRIIGQKMGSRYSVPSQKYVA